MVGAANVVPPAGDDDSYALIEALPVPNVFGPLAVIACQPRSTRPLSETSMPWKNGTPEPVRLPAYGVATFVHPDPVVR